MAAKARKSRFTIGDWLLSRWTARGDEAALRTLVRAALTGRDASTLGHVLREPPGGAAAPGDYRRGLARAIEQLQRDASRPGPGRASARRTLARLLVPLARRGRPRQAEVNEVIVMCMEDPIRHADGTSSDPSKVDRASLLANDILPPLFRLRGWPQPDLWDPEVIARQYRKLRRAKRQR